MINKPKPMMCEWNKRTKSWAINNEAHAVAAVIVGPKHIRLCRSCAELDKFKNQPIISRFLL